MSTTLSGAYHFTFFHVWPCLILLLIFGIFSWDNRPQCCSLWPRAARPQQLPQLPGKSPAFPHRDPKPATVTEHRQPVGPVCLTSTQEQPGRLCQHSVCCAWLFIRNGKFHKNCPFSEPWSQLACVLAYECFSVSLDLMLFSFFVFHVCQRDCQMNVEMEIYWQWPSYFVFLGHLIFLCDVTDWSSWQFVIMPVHLSVLSTTTNCDMSTNWIDFRTRTCCIRCCLRQTDRQLFTVCKKKN